MYFIFAVKFLCFNQTRASDIRMHELKINERN